MLDAAATAFWRDGFVVTDLGAVAAAAGTTKPSVYRRFGSKKGLFLAALAHYGARQGARPLQAFLAEDDIAAAVRAFFRVAVEGQTAHDRPTGSLFACAAAPLAEDLPEVGARLTAALAAGEAALAGGFDAAMAAGALPPGFPSGARARLMLDAMNGLALRARAGVSRADMLADAETYAEAVLCKRRGAHAAA